MARAWRDDDSGGEVVIDPAVTPPRVERLLAHLDRDLPALARESIPYAPTATAPFLAAPDDPAQHKPEWHQFGIITHTRRVVAALRDEVPAALRAIDPAIARRVERDLAGRLDGLARRDLLAVAGYWHDLGKFTSRTRGRRGGWRFINHARDSAAIILGTRPYERLALGARYGLTRAQTAYVARLAELHYAPMELKQALDRAPTAPGADVYDAVAARLGAEGYAICCLFWADTLGKGDTPRQRAQRPALRELLARTLRATDARLAPAIGEAAAAG